MNPVAERGFSLVKFLLIFLLIVLVIGGGIFGVFYFNKSAQTAEADTVVSNIVDQIQTNNTEASFQSFSDALKGSDVSSTYYSWLFWSSTFKEQGITIQKPASAVTYTNSSLLATDKNQAVITYHFKTDKNSTIYIELVHLTGEWKIEDYGTAA